MSTCRIALANLEFPASPDQSVRMAEEAIAQASGERVDLICFPECFVPGYRAAGKHVPPPDQAFLERAWSIVAGAAARGNVGVVLGTERVNSAAVVITALVVNRDGSRAGFQDKVQIDPSEEGTYAAGAGRRVFQAGALTFGIAICHEGWRYPKRCARRPVSAHSWSSTRSFTRPSPAATGRRPTRIRPARSMKRRRSVGPPRTRATSRR